MGGIRRRSIARTAVSSKRVEVKIREMRTRATAVEIFRYCCTDALLHTSISLNYHRRTTFCVVAGASKARGFEGFACGDILPPAHSCPHVL